MRDDGPEQLIDAWERAACLAKPMRGLAMLEALSGEKPADRTTPLAVVDTALAELRAAWFGPMVPMVATCPRCRAEYEFQLDLAALDWATAHPAPVQLCDDGAWVQVRPPCTADLLALAHVAEPEAYADALFRRCVDGGAAPHEAALPAAARARAAEALSLAGHGPRTVEVACGACGASWQPLVDMTAILWTEIDCRARRLLHEVCRIADAFHWSERDILALSPARREFYLDAIG